MKKHEFILDEERELGLSLCTVIPPLVLFGIFLFTLIIWFLLAAIIMVSIFIILYLHFYGKLIIDEDVIIIKAFKNKYIIPKDIIFLESVRNVNYIQNVCFYINFKKDFVIPKRYLRVYNKKFQKMIADKIIDIPVVSRIVF